MVVYKCVRAHVMYRTRKLERIRWLLGKHDAADVLTKEILSQRNTMWKLIRHGEVGTNANGSATEEIGKTLWRQGLKGQAIRSKFWNLEIKW